MRIQVLLTVDVRSTASFEEIEQACVSASRTAGRMALEQVLTRREQRRRRNRRAKGRGRRRTVLTRVGYVSFHRGRSRRVDGSRFSPLDDELGLPAHHEASPQVRRRGCELAACHPYREAARLLSAEVGAQVDHRAIWRWVQADGNEALKSRAEKVNAMFGDGEAPPQPSRPIPERLTVAVDATGIRLIEGEGGSVKVAVSFTGTEQLSASKRRLVGRHIFADICEPDPFGQALAYELERTYGAHRIGSCMLLADGETWIKQLAGRLAADGPLPVRPLAIWRSRSASSASEKSTGSAGCSTGPSPRRITSPRNLWPADGKEIPTRQGSSRSTSPTTAITCTPSGTWAQGSGCTARLPPKSTSSSP